MELSVSRNLACVPYSRNRFVFLVLNASKNMELTKNTKRFNTLSVFTCSDICEIRHFPSLVASRLRYCCKKLSESRAHGAKRFKEYGTYRVPLIRTVSYNSTSICLQLEKENDESRKYRCRWRQKGCWTLRGGHFIAVETLVNTFSVGIENMWNLMDFKLTRIFHYTFGFVH